MRAVIKEPFKRMRVEDIENSLESYQKIVGGMIEGFYELEQFGIVGYINEEGKILNLPLNFWCYQAQDIICGTAVFFGDDNNGGAKDLTDEQIEMIGRYLMPREF